MDSADTDVATLETDCQPARGNSAEPASTVDWIRNYVQDYVRRRGRPIRPAGSAPHRQLLRITGRLFADAGRDCRRDGATISDSELCARVGARIGLCGTEVAQCLGRAGMLSPHAYADAAGPLSLGQAGQHRRVATLANEILGERERRVFLARCRTPDPASLDDLATELGVTRERVHQLEVSARSKIAAALAQEHSLDRAGAATQGRTRALSAGSASRPRPAKGAALTSR